MLFTSLFHMLICLWLRTKINRERERKGKEKTRPRNPENCACVKKPLTEARVFLLFIYLTFNCTASSSTFSFGIPTHISISILPWHSYVSNWVPQTNEFHQNFSWSFFLPPYLGTLFCIIMTLHPQLLFTSNKDLSIILKYFISLVSYTQSIRKFFTFIQYL